MTYKETVDYLFSMLPMYQRMGKSAYKEDLTNTINLLSALGNPQTKFKSIHVAGTNGKGTSAHSLAAILQSAGYKTGLYTSPHLKSYRERIRIDGQQVDEQFVVQFVQELTPHVEKIKPSFFEVTVAMAFQYFADHAVDIAVVETGLGGRLDSTNVISPEVSLITNIGLDHTDLLGDTLEKIAHEKAGIIKEKTPVVVGKFQEETYPIFEEIASGRNAKLILAPETSWANALPELSPDYLRKNTPGVIGVIECLKQEGWNIPDNSVREGLSNINTLTGLKGRMQVLAKSPLTIADISHNREGLKALFGHVTKLVEGKLFLIFATVKDKDLAPLFSLLTNEITIYWTEFNVPRALSVDALAESAKEHGLVGETAPDVNVALKLAQKEADPSDLILVTGSTFLVGEIHDL